jgi:hypothetical protein
MWTATNKFGFYVREDLHKLECDLNEQLRAHYSLVMK